MGCSSPQWVLKFSLYNHTNLCCHCRVMACASSTLKWLKIDEIHVTANFVANSNKDRCWWTVGAMHNKRLCISKDSIFSVKKNLVYLLTIVLNTLECVSRCIYCCFIYPKTVHFAWEPWNNIAVSATPQSPLSLSKHYLLSHITMARATWCSPAHNLIPYTPIATSTSAPNTPPTARHSLLLWQNAAWISPLKNIEHSCHS